jgi:hypothetical protein
MGETKLSSCFITRTKIVSECQNASFVNSERFQSRHSGIVLVFDWQMSMTKTVWPAPKCMQRWSLRINGLCLARITSPFQQDVQAGRPLFCWTTWKQMLPTLTLFGTRLVRIKLPFSLKTPGREPIIALSLDTIFNVPVG